MMDKITSSTNELQLKLFKIDGLLDEIYEGYYSENDHDNESPFKAVNRQQDNYPDDFIAKLQWLKNN